MASSSDGRKLFIAELFRYRYHYLADAASLVCTTPAILAGYVGLSKEERPKQSLIRRHDSQSIADQIIKGFKPLASTGFRCSLLLADLAGQGRIILPRRKEKTADGAEALLELSLTDLEGVIERFRCGLSALKVLQSQYEGDWIQARFTCKWLQPFVDGTKSEGGLYDVQQPVLHLKRRRAMKEQPDEVDMTN